MRIAFLMQDTGAIYGAERATLDLVEGLAGAGVEVVVLLIEETRLRIRKSMLQEGFAARGVPVSCMKTSWPFSWSLVRAIRKQLATAKAEILHTVGPKATVHGYLAARSVLPLVSTVHGWLFRPDPKERLHEWLERKVLRHYVRVVVLSTFYRDLLVRLGFAPERIAYIPSGIDADRMVSRERAEKSLAEERPFTVGMMGRLSEEKNYDMGLQAARITCEANRSVRFVIAGEGRERERVKGMVEAQGLGGAVELAGYMERDEFMKRIHVLAVCSTIENLPYNIKEAMCWCRPVVATRVGGIVDLVKDGETGFLVAPGDTARLAERLQQLAADRELLLRMGKAGRDAIEALFSMKETVRQHVDLYKGIAT